MKRNVFPWLVVACLTLGQVIAADESAGTNEEIKKLSRFEGKWKVEEISEASPFGPAGKSSYEAEGRIIYNGNVFEEKGTGTAIGKPTSYTAVTYYDPVLKSFKGLYYDSNGVVFPAEGSIEGNVWKMRGTAELEGKKYQLKGVTNLAPDGKKITYEWTYSENGTDWKTMFKGTSTRLSK